MGYEPHFLLEILATLGSSCGWCCANTARKGRVKGRTTGPKVDRDKFQVLTHVHNPSNPSTTLRLYGFSAILLTETFAGTEWPLIVGTLKVGTVKAAEQRSTVRYTSAIVVGILLQST